MKKYLIAFLALFLTLILIFAGVFFWKGGHHALAAASLLEEWLDADDADQSLILQLTNPGFSTDSATGNVQPEIRQWTLTADSFWTEYADRQVFGLRAAGVTAYLDRNILYLDTGRAYFLPDISGSLRELAAGLMLYGQVTKTKDTYYLTMKTDALELSASVAGVRTVQIVTVNVILPDDTVIYATITPKATQSHPIPRQVSDAMVRSRMEPPTPLMEPLNLLLPAAEQLLPLSGDLSLGVSCGILELSETVGLTVKDGKASILREGMVLDLKLPQELSALSPAAFGALLLRDGEMTRDGSMTQFTMDLPGDATAALLESLVPQVAGLGITLDSSSLALTMEADRLTDASLTAEGSVPFLFTTIPVSFSAALTIS